MAQGARPCAVMDSLCFGMPTSRHNRHLEDGVVAGIAAYGNAFGVPNIGGKTIYDQRYEGNILVNALAAGLCKADDMRTAAASGLGNKLIYVGAPTGRDGILVRLSHLKSSRKTPSTIARTFKSVTPLRARN